MDIHVGHFQNPDELPGLAHLLEHMLFLGTKKYPNNGEYTEFMGKHGGTHNAKTGDEHTHYFFDIPSDYLEGALDRFSRFFIDPLFDESCVEKELIVIDQEFQLSLSSWNTRISHIIKTLCKGHPFGRFAKGNLETLKIIPEQREINIRDKLIKFYETFYSANIMKLAVYGKESLDDLERMVREKFSDIINRNVEIESPLGSPINSEYMQKMIVVECNQEIRWFVLDWTLPGHQDCSYQLSLFNRTDSGSLHAYLSKFEWFSSLKATYTIAHDDFTMVRVTVYWKFTALETIPAIIDSIFAYIKMINDSGVQKSYHDRLLSLRELSFKFNPDPTVINVTKRIAENLHYCRPSNVLWGRQADEFDFERIQFITDQFGLDNVVMVMMVHTISGEGLVELYMGTKFTVIDIPAEFTAIAQGAKLDFEFKMPQPNRYFQMPSLEVARAISTEMIDLRIIDDHIKFWFKSKESAVSMATIEVALTSNRPTSVSDYLCTKLFIEMFKLEYNDIFGEAREMNLQFEMRIISRGMVFSFTGINEILPSFLFDVFEKLLEFNLSNTAHFVPAKDLLIRELLASCSSNLRSRSKYNLDLLVERYFQPWDLFQQLLLIEFSDLEEYFKDNRLFPEGNLHVLYHGGIASDEEASDFARKLKGTFSTVKLCEKKRIPRERAVALPPRQSFVFHDSIASNGSSITVYIQTGSSRDPKTKALTSLLGSIINDSFFNELRVNQHLAYHLRGTLMENHSSTGIAFVLCSSISPMKLDRKIEKYIDKILLKHVENMTDDDFDHHKQKVTRRMSLEDINPFDLWMTSTEGGKDEALPFVQKASQQDLCEFMRERVITSAPERRKLSFHTWGSDLKDQLNPDYSRLSENVRVFTDLKELEGAFDYFPPLDDLKEGV